MVIISDTMRIISEGVVHRVVTMKPDTLKVGKLQQSDRGEKQHTKKRIPMTDLFSKSGISESNDQSVLDPCNIVRYI